MSSREASPNSITYQYDSVSPHRSPSRQCYPEHDIISKLKVQVFEKDQNKRNYSSLLCKFHQLQDEFGKICEIKKSHEIALQQLEADQRNKDIIDLKNRNENLFNDLNERIAMNKKLYSENNSLFHELELKAGESQDLQDHICEQENVINKLNSCKDDLEQKIFNLNQVREKQEKQILDLTNQINNLNNANDGQGNLINARLEQNTNLLNEINDEKNMNKNLILELRNTENNISNTQLKLNNANETIRCHQNKANNISNLIGRNKEDISNVNTNLLKETATLNQLISDNTHLNQLVEDRNAQIQNLNQDNELLKQNNVDINCENTKFNNLICAYKKHLVLLISQNKKIAAEIQCLIGRDEQVRNILERDAHLQDVRYENHQLINDSLEKIKIFMNGDVNNSQNVPSNPKMTQLSQSSRIKRPTYSTEQNRNININTNQNEQNSGIISNMNNNINSDYNNINSSNINRSLNNTGSRINPGLSSNINNINNTEEQGQGQGDEEEMINMVENEQQIEQQDEQENQNEEEYNQEQNSNIN